MVHFVGAGPGAPDLITLRGARLLGEADVVIYAGKLIHPELLSMAKEGSTLYSSVDLTGEELCSIIERAEAAGQASVWLHTGDSDLFGEIREQMDVFRQKGISCDVTPGIPGHPGTEQSVTRPERPIKREDIAYLSFSRRGDTLAHQLAGVFGGKTSCTREGVTLRDWTQEQFSSKRALVFIGAVGVAVRAASAFLTNRGSDPAVIVVDENARFVVPIASGHLSGANMLAREMASVCGATAVITTVPKTVGIFAFDEWARVQGCELVDARKIREVSARALSGEEINVCSSFPIDGAVPDGIHLTDKTGPDVWVDVRPHAGLCVVPRILTLGIGCKQSTTRKTLEERFSAFCSVQGILPQAIFKAASIDRKASEQGLISFCAAHGWPLETYSASELRAVKGKFSMTDIVTLTFGVDNVCERAAVKAAGGTLLVRKDAGSGVTFAVAQQKVSLDWRTHEDE